MASPVVRKLCRSFLHHHRCQRGSQVRGLTSGTDGADQGEGRIPRAGKYRSPWTIFKEEFEGIKTMKPAGTDIPREVDFLIVGGGVVGSSVAYFLKQWNPRASNILVVERDPVYTRASSMLSAGGIRHQFSLAENVQLSMFSSQFLRDIKEHLSVIHEDPPDVQFQEHGYLFLAPPRSADKLLENVKMQQSLGAKVELLSKSQLEERYPWLNVSGIECASLGAEGEGWFDPWSLVRALKQKNLSLGVKYVHGELTEFIFDHKKNNPKLDQEMSLEAGVIRSKSGREAEVKFAMVINCAGAWAADVAEMAQIGLGQDELMVPLPVEPRKRFVYVFHCPEGPKLDCPFLIDPSGSYMRREGLGGHYICGSSPGGEFPEPEIANFDVDFDFYENKIWPDLANRVPAFECSKLKSAWAGYYDFNTFDQNLVIGNHPYLKNFYFANGLSGHGLQHAIGVGHGLMELIVDGTYSTIDLSKFHFDRFLTNEPIVETGIV